MRVRKKIPPYGGIFYAGLCFYGRRRCRSIETLMVPECGEYWRFSFFARCWCFLDHEYNRECHECVVVCVRTVPCTAQVFPVVETVLTVARLGKVHQIFLPALIRVSSCDMFWFCIRDGNAQVAVEHRAILE